MSARTEVIAPPVRVSLRDLLACDTEVFRRWESVLGFVAGLCEMRRPGSRLVWTPDRTEGHIDFYWIAGSAS